MNTKKIVLLSALIAASAGAHSQSVSYKTTTDDPDDYKRTNLYLDLFTVDTYLNPNLGSAIKLETMLGGRIMPWVQWKFSWADANTSHVVSGYPTTAGGLKKQRIIDIGSAFFLSSHNKTKRVKITLSSHSSGNYTHTKYVMIPAQVKRMFGVEGGIYINRRALEFDDESHGKFRYQSADGAIDAPIGSVGGSGTNQPAGEYYKPLSMAHIFSLYGGIHYRTIHNVTIATGDYGHRSNRSITDVYADVMVAPVVSIAHVVDVAGKEWILAPQSGAIKRIGWKAGFVHHNSQKTSFSYNFEFGQKPGPVMGDDLFTNGTYVAMGMGLNIGFNKYLGLPHKKKQDQAEQSKP